MQPIVVADNTADNQFTAAAAPSPIDKFSKVHSNPPKCDDPNQVLSRYIPLWATHGLIRAFASALRTRPASIAMTSAYLLKNLLAVALLQLCAMAVVGSGSSSGSFSDMSDDSSSSLEGVTELLSSAKQLKVGPAVLAAIAILGGGIVCLAGYRLFRPTVFCCAFIIGGLFVAGIVETAFASMSWMPTASWIGFGIGGLIAGVVVLMLYSASIFLTGAAGGVMLAFTLNTSVGAKIYPNNPDVVLVVLAVVLGIVGGLLALKLEKPVLITTTAIVGATVCVWGVGYFAGDYPNGADLKQFRSQKANGDWVYNIPDAWWGYIAGMVVLFLLGMSVQIKKTARGYDHGGKTESHAISKPSGHAAV
ncbi:hypothetical protein PRIC2_007598 [Phytophthora ramorum]